MGAGRPSEYNFELCQEICEEVANGKNIIATLKSNESYPSWSTFRKWKNEHSELSTLYVKAIQDKSEAVIFEMDEISAELRKGELDASTANVLIQTLKWKAAKFYPKMFGDNKNVDVTTKGEAIQKPISLTAEEVQKISNDLENEV